MPPITAEQLVTTLENMTRAWEALPAEQRLPKTEEMSLFDDAYNICNEMARRWHSGESMHPDREALAEQYPRTEDGIRQLQKDIWALKNEPFVSAADLKLRLVKYTADAV
eukprot:NODE_26778_length_538_cov_2.995134.p2 GENE.NODE_26778_length_538_cov_2.995134~~NODE_26778_length_538_cov_2.995134.p2  ORF type:complete len:110 (-),score=24.56 NODE_26778_length_538_cov_2.995134:110-439(-)